MCVCVCTCVKNHSDHKQPSPDAPIDVNISGLSDAVAAILSLCVHGWVPVAVVKDHRVGTRQVDSDASRAGGEDEAEDARVFIEAFH